MERILQALEFAILRLAEALSDDPDDYEYTQTWRYDQPENGRHLSVESLRKEGWKVHQTYGTSDGDLYFVMRRRLPADHPDSGGGA